MIVYLADWLFHDPSDSIIIYRRHKDELMMKHVERAHNEAIWSNVGEVSDTSNKAVHVGRLYTKIQRCEYKSGICSTLLV
jgi:hypothetical protein